MFVADRIIRFVASLWTNISVYNVQSRHTRHMFENVAAIVAVICVHLHSTSTITTTYNNMHMAMSYNILHEAPEKPLCRWVEVIGSEATERRRIMQPKRKQLRLLEVYISIFMPSNYGKPKVFYKTITAHYFGKPHSARLCEINFNFHEQ